MLDALTRGSEVAVLVRDFFEREAAPLRSEIASLRAELATVRATQPIKGAPGEPGRDAPTVEDLAPLIEQACSAVADRMRGAPGERGEPGPPGGDGLNGKDADPVTPEQIAEAVAAHLAENPPAAGRDGQDGVNGKDAEPISLEQVSGAVAAFFEANPPPVGKDGSAGKDGVDAEPVSDEKIASFVEAHIKANPPAPGKDGRDGNDGVGLAGALLDNHGHLVVTLTDGSVKTLGVVVGRDGNDGNDGRDGERGAAGLSLTEFDSDIRDGGRTLVLSFEDGETKHTAEHQLDTMIYRGAYKVGQTYQPGDTVSFGGQLFHCNAETLAKPEDGVTDWTLCSRRGRDGKDADPTPLLRLIEEKFADAEARITAQLEATLKRRGY